MGWASCSEDNEEAVANGLFITNRPNRRAVAPVPVERIPRSTPVGSRNGGSEPQLAKVEDEAAANCGRACRAALELLQRVVNPRRNR